ncbi:LacI family DNA-binding transcriptional regulator [Vagococcus fluvialis]|uniref:LacI family DNA-binding transcriptional regulator n=1 Tax=Vagococcus fluvialis TaxID=2738 RepID=UPI003B5AB5B5
MKKITIKEIAKEAGVSIATVSNVINQKPNKVSENTKRKIKEIMEKHNYAPNMNARSLVSSRSKMIGMLYYSIKEEINFSDPFISELMTGIELEAKKQGNFIMFHGFNNMDDIDMLQSNWKFDGFIVVGAFQSYISELIEKINEPIIFIDSYYHEKEIRENIYFVNNDDRQLTFEAVNLMIEEGHKEIAFFGPSFSMEEDGVVPQRVLGYKKALEKNNLVYNERLIFDENSIKNLVDANQDYSAVLINSDFLAAQYWHMMKKKSFDFKSTISFDNNVFSTLLSPSLSTVDLKQKEKGQISVQLINEVMNKEQIERAAHITIDGNLINRESFKSNGGRK